MPRKPTKKDLLLEAGLDIFYEKGFDRTTIDDIVGRADCGKGTFYRYFTGKEALFDELENRFRDLLFGEISENCPYQLPVKDFFNCALRTFVRVFKMHQRLGFIKFSRDQQTDGKMKCCDHKSLPSINYLQQYLKNAIKNGDIRQLKSESIIAALLGAAQFYLFRDFKLGIPFTESELEDTVDILLNGVLPS